MRSLTSSTDRKGYGIEAQRLRAEYLFALYPIIRVEASTDSTNNAELRALEKASVSLAHQLERLTEAYLAGILR